MNYRLMLLLLAVFSLGFVLSVAANPLPVIGCGWENSGDTILGLNGVGDPPLFATNVSVPDHVYEGSRALRLEHNDFTGPPQAYLCYIWGLHDGDQVTASVMRYVDAAGGGSACNLWAYWNDSVEVNPDNNDGDAGGDPNLNLQPGWLPLVHTWTVTGGHSGLVIEVLLYFTPGDTVWLDNFEIYYPNFDCTIQTPQMTIVAAQPQSFGAVKALFR